MLKTFIYSVLDSFGQEIKGVLFAENYEEALSKLRNQGYIVLELKEKSDKKAFFPFRKKFGIQELYTFTKEFNILLRSGIRVDLALELLIKTTTNEALKNILSQVLKDLKGGKSLSKAFEDTKKFTPLFITMIQVGETTGNLRSAFENLSDYFRFQIQFRSELINALTYPLFLVIASFLTLIFMFNFVIPKFFSLFYTTAYLPLPAKILIGLNKIFTFKNLFILFFSIFFIIFLKRFEGVKKILQIFYSYIFYLPIIGKLFLNFELSKFCYAMYSMLQSGIEFIKAFALSINLIQNSQLRNSLYATIDQIKSGRSIAEVFSQVYFLPEIVPHMISVGETSGELKDIFFELYQIFDERFKNQVKRLLVLVEPTVILVMGLIVGFIVLSLILTVVSISNIKF
ncbi:MAG: type II secretion system F family protein [Candidatus Desulfofervidus auxilii]|nr:type II secretion system F family protein [Candidatus Desulfofervidus auxilii]